MTSHVWPSWLSIVAFFTFAVYVDSRSISGVISGRLEDASDVLRVDVFSRNGRLHRECAVHSDGQFKLDGLGDGMYSLHVVGSVTFAYPSVLLEVSGDVLRAEIRLDPLIIPGRIAQEVRANSTNPLLIQPIGPATQLIPTSAGWSISSLLGNRFLVFQILAASFIILFPRYLKTLDKETLAEFTGETDEVSVDANEAIKAFMGYEAGVETEIIAPHPR